MSAYIVSLELKGHPDSTREVTLNATTFDTAKERAEAANPGFVAFRVTASNGYTDYHTEEG